MIRSTAIRLSLSAAACLLLASPALAANGPVEVTASTLNVRDRAWGSIIGQASRGQRFMSGAERGGWVAIDFGGRQAFVSAQHVREVRAEAVEVSASALNVRSGPSTRNGKLGLVQRGQRYVLLSEQGGWARIQLDGRAGWASLDYLRKLGGLTGGVLRTSGSSAPPASLPRPTPLTPAPITPGPAPVGGGLSGAYQGLTYIGAQIPRAGLYNSILRRAEPYGATVQHQSMSFVRGKVSHFGGPNDRGVTATETGAITLENLRALNNPLNPSPDRLRRQPESYYYVAMRWDYRPVSKASWRNLRILVTNPANGRSIVVRPVDWGPHTRTGRIIDLSPQSLVDLGLTTDQEALVAFAKPGAALGPVR